MFRCPGWNRLETTPPVQHSLEVIIVIIIFFVVPPEKVSFKLKCLTKVDFRNLRRDPILGTQTFLLFPLKSEF